MVVLADSIVDDTEEPKNSEMVDTKELEKLSIEPSIKAEVEEIDKVKISSTRELLKRVKDSANQKFAHSINFNVNNETRNYPKQTNESSPTVLRGSESPAWHGLLTKTLLKRQPNKQTTTISATTTPTTNKIKIKYCLDCGCEVKINKFKGVDSCSSCARKSSNKNSRTKIGYQRNIFPYFKEVRGEFKDFREIEAVRLQRRLEKLADIPLPLIQNFDEMEKKIVHWQSDSSANSCYLCTCSFNLLNRKHHCRLCGRIICSNVFSCLTGVPVKLLDGSVKDLKSCTKCHKSLFTSKRQNNIPTVTLKKINSLFKTFKHLKQQLLETIPKFNEYLLGELYTARPINQWRHDAWALRDTLILVSLHLRSTVQELSELAGNEALENPIWRVFGNNFKRAGNEFLQKNMFTLQILEINENNKLIQQLNTTEPVIIQAAQTHEETEISSSSLSFKKKINNFLPKILKEAFEPNNNDPQQNLNLIEFYSQNGDLETFSNSSVEHQIKILKEQLLQLKTDLNAANECSEDEKTDGLLRAIDEIEKELKILNKRKEEEIIA